jgi:predicted transcriptional regulator
MPLMAKKPAKAVLSVEIDAALKERLHRLSDKRGRKLVAEVTIMLRQYLAAEEPKEGFTDKMKEGEE